MRLRKRRGQAISLVIAAHPVASLLVTVAVTVAAAISGRTGRECLLVAATVLTGQVTVGWLDDVVDRNRDRQGGGPNKAVGRGWVDRGNVTFAIACAGLLLVPLSIANGTEAGLAYLGAGLSACT